MSAFTEHFAIVPDGPGCDYRLTAPLRWEVGRKGSALWYEVPTDFVFQSSVPRCIGWFMSPHDRRLLLPAALHDAMLLAGFDKSTAASQWHQAAIAMQTPKLVRMAGLLGILVATVR